MESIKVGYSHLLEARTAVADITKNFLNPKLIIYFAPSRNFKEIAESFKKVFPNTLTVGCTSESQFSNRGFKENSIVAMAFEGEIITKVLVMTEINKSPIRYLPEIKKTITMVDNNRNNAAIGLMCGNSGIEEVLLSVLNSELELKEIPLIGGSASGEAIFVSMNGEIYNNAAVLVLVNSNRRITFYRENIYSPRGNRHVVTKSDSVNRKVYELDNRPILDVYSEELGISKFAIKTKLREHPFGRLIGEDILITSPMEVNRDGSISFLSRIYNNSYVKILELSNPMLTLDETIGRINKKIDVSAAIIINCAFRTELYKEKNLMNKFTQKLSKLGNFIGFTCYGEQINNNNTTQTMVIACFE